MNEFELIRRFFTWPTPGTPLGVGDDAALLQLTAGMLLAVSADTLVSGRHFVPETDPVRLGRKALAVNLSDMAAMAAVPRWITLSLSLPPPPDEEWLAGFAAGLRSQADAHGVQLVGGDTTAGGLTIAVQILGEVPPGLALRRAGARVGDDVWVSGTLGDAALGLAHLLGELCLDLGDAAACLSHLEDPVPRVALGVALRGIATAAIDISDGFAADLGHLLAASGVGAEVQWPAVPLSPALRGWPDRRRVVEAALSGGDDYELCFTAPPAARAAVLSAGERGRSAVTRVGQIVSVPGLHILDGAGQPLELTRTGHDHFAIPAVAPSLLVGAERPVDKLAFSRTISAAPPSPVPAPSTFAIPAPAPGVSPGAVAPADRR